MPDHLFVPNSLLFVPYACDQQAGIRISLESHLLRYLGTVLVNSLKYAKLTLSVPTRVAHGDIQAATNPCLRHDPTT